MYITFEKNCTPNLMSKLQRLTGTIVGQYREIFAKTKQCWVVPSRSQNKTTIALFLVRSAAESRSNRGANSWRRRPVCWLPSQFT